MIKAGGNLLGEVSKMQTDNIKRPVRNWNVCSTCQHRNKNMDEGPCAVCHQENDYQEHTLISAKK